MGTINEALKELNESLNINKLLVIRYKDIIEKYLQQRSYLSQMQGTKARLSNTGYKIDNGGSGAIENRKRDIRDLEDKLPRSLSLSGLGEIYKDMSREELNHILTNEDISRIEDYINESDKLLELPGMGQRFKFTYAPVTYVAVRLEGDNLIYKPDREDGAEYVYDIDNFLKEKQRGKIYYLG